MPRAMTATWRLITMSFASDADGYMTSRYPKWTSFSKVHPVWDSSHCCAVRWRSRLSAGGASLPKSECRPNTTPHQSEICVSVRIETSGLGLVVKKKQARQFPERKSGGQQKWQLITIYQPANAPYRTVLAETQRLDIRRMRTGG